MGVKAVVESVDDLSEEMQAFYKQEGDVYVLDIDGVDDHPKVRGVVTANRSNKDKRDQYKAELDTLKKRLEGLPEDFDSDTYEHLREAAEGNGGQMTDEQKAEMRNALEKKLEKQYLQQIEERDARIDKLSGSIRKSTVDGALTRAMDEAQIDPKHKKMLLPYFKTASKIDVEESDDGTFKPFVETDMGPQDIGKFVSDWAATDGKEYVSKSAGPSPRGGSNGSGGKTLTRSQFDALSQHERAQAVKDGTKIVD